MDVLQKELVDLGFTSRDALALHPRRFQWWYLSPLLLLLAALLRTWRSPPPEGLADVLAEADEQLQAYLDAARCACRTSLCKLWPLSDQLSKALRSEVRRAGHWFRRLFGISRPGGRVCSSFGERREVPGEAAWQRVTRLLRPKSQRFRRAEQRSKPMRSFVFWVIFGEVPENA